jgi:opacity protein-like surface antigen
VFRSLLWAGLALAAITGVSSAQSVQRWSIQGSGALVFPTAEETDFENETRLGWEAQVRYTFSRFSIGGGYQRSTVYRFATGDFSAAVSVLFLEPRYVAVAGSSAALYLAGRVGASQLVCSPADDCVEQEWDVALGGGAGVLIRLSNRVAIDVGSQYFSTRYDIAAGEKRRAGYVLARLGLSIGL